MRISDLYENDDYPEGHAMGHGRRDDIEYIEKKAKGVVTRVIAVLEGRQSAGWTRMANRYRKLNILIDRLVEKRQELNVQLKGKAVELFDAEDEVLTRVVETVSLTATLGKKETRTPSPRLNQKEFMKELYELAAQVSNLIPDLGDRIKEIEDKYTELGKPQEISPKFGIKLKDPVDEAEEDTDNWAQMFDKKLHDIKSRLKTL